MAAEGVKPMITSEQIDIWTQASILKILDRAIAVNHHIETTDILKSPAMRAWGEVAIEHYRGTNDYVLLIQLRQWNDFGLTAPQIARCFNRLIDERFEMTCDLDAVVLDLCHLDSNIFG